MNTFRVIVLIAAAFTTGLIASVFLYYAHTLMPGLGRTDDRTFVGAFQAIDTAIINPLFLSTFFGALVLTGLAVFLHLGESERSVLPWAGLSLVLYLVVFIITVRVHVPLNDAIKAAGNPDRITDLAAVRGGFDETRWARWNTVRGVLSIVAFASLLWALVLTDHVGGT